jgi:CDP-paratose 2-epimerase
MNNNKKTMLVTGSSGLIGSEVVSYFAKNGWNVIGIDNNQRAVFFGIEGDTQKNKYNLEKVFKNNFKHIDLDIRNRLEIINLIKKYKPDAIIHTAAQPSHDKSSLIPFDDFDINAVGTLNLLESVRINCPESPFIHLSTSKVYGDLPNTIKLKELKTRWDYDDDNYINGINENFSIDQSKHSPFGASKLSADIMVQEYGRYFGMYTCCLRGGCLTGPNHRAVELHGFLNYMIKCNIQQISYKIFGYKGKQVRDNIHAYDVARFIDFFIQSPKKGEVYNIGGGRSNSCSILEAFELIEKISEKKQLYEYIDENRIGDHICYISDMSKIYKDYPNWDITINLTDIISQIVNSYKIN